MMVNTHPPVSPSPPTAIAADHFHIGFAPLALDQVYTRADDAGNGAVVIMSGTVRNQTGGKAVVALEYQAYEPMALKVFQHISEAIRHQWPAVNRVVMHHRIGRLTLGEISVLVAVGCPHRAEAFQACQYGIDTLKHTAPIWKKEYFRGPDGVISGEWTQGCVACPE